MARLKKIGVVSLANLQALAMALMGLFLGLFVTFGTASMFPIFGGVGILSIFLLPILYGAMGWIGGALIALVYNLVAGWIGGIEIVIVN